MERVDRTRPSFSLCTWSTRLVGSERRHPVYVLELAPQLLIALVRRHSRFAQMWEKWTNFILSAP
jgi:hypothetical protein